MAGGAAAATPEQALVAVARIAEQAFPVRAPEVDPIYEEADFAADVFEPRGRRCSCWWPIPGRQLCLRRSGLRCSIPPEAGRRRDRPMGWALLRRSVIRASYGPAGPRGVG
jgi:hypothetical protein